MNVAVASANAGAKASAVGAYTRLRELCQPHGFELHRGAANQVHFLVKREAAFLELARRLQGDGYYLVTVIANDERELEDHCFKLYYVFSHPSEDLFCVIEDALSPGKETPYNSLRALFPASYPFECQIADLFGLYPLQGNEDSCLIGTYLHAGYPASLFPLRRDVNHQALSDALAGESPAWRKGVDPCDLPLLLDGESYLPVGPVHAGVIEPGHFSFRIASETIGAVEIRLGYAHKGIERLFQSRYKLQDGWRLAERVCGDSAFAHSLAYCRAVEELADVVAPLEAALLRGLFLELERIANHIGDCSALAHDVALDLFASEIAVLREEMMSLNQRLAGNRFLRGLNRPGGVCLPHPLDISAVRQPVSRVVNRFLDLAQFLAERNDFRERTIDIGVLPGALARRLGVTGLAARASGMERDYRLQHPLDPYSRVPVRDLFGRFFLPIFHHDLVQFPRGEIPHIFQRPMTGDVFSRFLIRVLEVDLSARLIEAFLETWGTLSSQTQFLAPLDLSRIPNFEFGLGYAEGWRGDVVYWLMKDKFERIYRCKVRDPSTLNWPGLKAAVDPRHVDGRRVETSLVDFPIINKSFNLSYSGNDL